ncbi:SRPBCC family protein [Gephyromycinifex aptenodytis]|uniref:SRPBCC family protein n=1 Tax=Gephyromycinifex aptenodytis TaxID=2716227 RepID=UPI001D0209C6|nr:SRPBCC family protein [Gephyromycinifex aptenodytis]
MEPMSVTIVDRGPQAVARQARVTASAEEIFAVLSNPHRHHEFDGSGTLRPDVIGPRELQQSDRFRVSMKMGVPYAITNTVTRLEPGRLIEWMHMGGHRWRFELEPQADGTTLVTEIFDYSTARSVRALEIIKAPERNAESIRASLIRLQQLFG